MTNRGKQFISVVCYVRNASKELKSFIKELNRVLEETFERYELIFVNDASEDESQAIIEAFAGEIRNVSVSLINMSFYSGVEASMNAGVDLAIGDFVYQFDTIQLTYKPELISEVYQRALEGYDVVFAGPSKISGLNSKLFYWFFNHYSNNNRPISQDSFLIISRRGINRVAATDHSALYRKAVYSNCGLATDRILYESNVRQESNKSFHKQKELAGDSLILYTCALQKLSFYLSVLFLGITILIGIYTCCVYFGAQKPIEGWTPIMLYLSMGFFGIFLILSVIIKYLSVILNLVFKKKMYLIKSVNKIN